MLGVTEGTATVSPWEGRLRCRTGRAGVTGAGGGGGVFSSRFGLFSPGRRGISRRRVAGPWAHPPCPGQGTVVVERWWQVPLSKEGRQPRLHPRRHRIYRLVEDTKHLPKGELELILTQSVESTFLFTGVCSPAVARVNSLSVPFCPRPRPGEASSPPPVPFPLSRWWQGFVPRAAG